MSLNKSDLISLAKKVANANPSAATAYSYEGENFTYSDLNETLRTELRELASTYALYRENKNTIFELIETVIDDVLPKKVLEAYGQFAEVRVFPQGDKPVFVQKITAAARRRAKQFITKVGLAGVYEVFKLDGRSLEIPTEAIGGAAQISFEEFLDGRIDFADVLEIVMEGMDEAVYREIAKALETTLPSMPGVTIYQNTSFNETAMDKLISVVESYGTPTIYCTREFAATMLPATGWISENMKDAKWANGYLGNYKGARVIILPQSFEDETNKKKVIDPAFAWIIPAGEDKPVKVAFEGQTCVREVEANQDWSREIQTYKKLGVGVLVSSNVAVYKNTSLVKTFTI